MIVNKWWCDECGKVLGYCKCSKTEPTLPVRPESSSAGLVEGVLRDGILKLRTEVNCRIEHGAESGGHLDYVQKALDELLKPNDLNERRET
jgi:hypothetical protein